MADVALAMSRSYGDALHCRKALHRAVQCSSDYPEHVCEVLLTFERVEGKWHKENTTTWLPGRFVWVVVAVYFKERAELTCAVVLCPTAGSLEDWDAAVQKTDTRLGRLKEQQAKVGAPLILPQHQTGSGLRGMSTLCLVVYALCHSTQSWWVKKRYFGIQGPCSCGPVLVV